MSAPTAGRGRSSSPPTASSHSSPSSSDYPSDPNNNSASQSSNWPSMSIHDFKSPSEGLLLEEVLKDDAFGPSTSDAPLPMSYSAPYFSDSLQLFPFAQSHAEPQSFIQQSLLHYPPSAVQSPVSATLASLQDMQMPDVQCPSLIYPMSHEGSPTDYSTSYFYSASHPHTPASSSSSPPSRPAAVDNTIDLPSDSDLVFPPSSISGLKILLPTIPQTGAKSRVETQIKVVLQLVMPDGDPLEGRKVGTWGWIRLERGAALRKRARTYGKNCGPEPKPAEVLQLVATVHPASQPSLTAYRCASCHQREVKRTARKLALRVRPPPSPSPSPPPGAPAVSSTRESEQDGDDKRMVIFNCADMQEIRGGEVSLPTRLVCYCRHHREKIGFLVNFKLYTHSGRLVAEGTSPPIMITDDHKSRNPQTEPEQPTSLTRLDQSASYPSLSAAVDEAVPKRRRAADDAGDADRSQRPRKKTRSAPSTPPIASRRASPAHFSGPVPLLPLTSLPFSSSATSSPTYPLSAPLSAPSSARHTPAEPAPPRPKILRLIPPTGPVAGGIEVTLLGTSFTPGTAPVFGDVVASSWTMYGGNAMVCILPPSPCPGPVRVGLEGVEPVVGEELAVFCYEDQTDKALMELALQVVGLKMNGRIDNARDVAMQIMVSGRTGSGNENVLPSTGGMPYGQTMYAANRLLGRTGGAYTNGTDFQSTVMSLIRLLEAPLPATEAMTRLLSRTGPTGLTLLHLAVILNFHRLSALLLALGSDANVRDANGFTALHFAALHGRVRCARLLVDAGADAEMVHGLGMTAAEIASARGELEVSDVLEEQAFGDAEELNGMDADESAEGEMESQASSRRDVEADLSDAADYGLASPSSVSLAFFPASSPALSPERSPAPSAPLTPTLDKLPPLPDGSDTELAEPPSDDPSSPPPPYTYWPTTLVDYSSSLLQRALLQLQSPPGVVPWEKMPSVMPALPWEKMVPQLHLPGMSVVFQVNVPGWPSSLPWQSSSQGDGSEKAVPYDWRGLYGGAWWQKQESAKSARAAMPVFVDGQTAPEQEEVSVPPTSVDAAPVAQKAVRRVDYNELDMTDGELNSFSYQTRPDARKVQSDRMLVLFWIPILIIVVAWGMIQSVPYILAGLQHCSHLLGPRMLPL